MRLVEVRGENAPEVLDREVFGGVLCHGVLMYLDDPAPVLDSLCRLTAPGGLLSIVTKNVEVMAMRHAHEGDWAAALAAFDSDRQVNGLGVDTRGDHVDALSAMIADRGVDPIAWYGVRLFTDGWTPDRPVTDPEDLVLQVELEASRRDPYRRLSRLFHLLGRRHPLRKRTAPYHRLRVSPGDDRELRPLCGPAGDLLLVDVSGHDRLVGAGDHGDEVRETERGTHDERVAVVADTDA